MKVATAAGEELELAVVASLSDHREIKRMPQGGWPSYLLAACIQFRSQR